MIAKKIKTRPKVITIINGRNVDAERSSIKVFTLLVEGDGKPSGVRHVIDKKFVYR